jgi:hypothetical protein
MFKMADTQNYLQARLERRCADSIMARGEYDASPQGRIYGRNILFVMYELFLASRGEPYMTPYMILPLRHLTATLLCHSETGCAKARRRASMPVQH